MNLHPDLSANAAKREHFKYQFATEGSRCPTQTFPLLIAICNEYTIVNGMLLTSHNCVIFRAVFTIEGSAVEGLAVSLFS
jgi:hypothetical protein